MGLKEHYLAEDYPTVVNEIDNLLVVFSQVLKVAETAEFSTRNEQLAKIDSSLTLLRALNIKKTKREALAYSESIRRNYF